MRRANRQRLAPLDPDAFLRWAWMSGPRDKGTSPLTVDDLAFEYGLPAETVRRWYVSLAAMVRRNQRLGREPLEGIR